MKSTQKTKVWGFILGVSILLGVGLASSSTVQAQWRRDDDRWERSRRDRDYRRDRDRDRDYRRRDDRRGRYSDYRYNIYQDAFNRGYQQGLQTGSSDSNRGQSYNPQRSRYYKNADYGYNSSYGGNKGQYKQYYRDGFLRGYREGYQRYDRYDPRRRSRSGIGFPFPW